MANKSSDVFGSGGRTSRWELGGKPTETVIGKPPVIQQEASVQQQVSVIEDTASLPGDPVEEFKFFVNPENVISVGRSHRVDYPYAVILYNGMVIEMTKKAGDALLEKLSSSFVYPA